MSDVSFYDKHYSTSADEIYTQIRLEVFGEDLGQTSFLTADEYRQFFLWLGLEPASRVLEIGSGSGLPALYMAQTTGCSVLGLDINEIAVTSASKICLAQGLSLRVQFQRVDVRDPLPLGDCSFDAIVSIDAVILIPNRLRLLQELYRVLRPGGRILYTDTTVVTGLVSNEEIAARSFISYYEFAPPGENERLLRQAGFKLERTEDVTKNVEIISRRWHDAREKRQGELIQIENTATFECLQRFHSVVYSLSTERRLSRIAFVACKPEG